MGEQILKEAWAGCLVVGVLIGFFYGWDTAQVWFAAAVVVACLRVGRDRG